MLCRPAACGCKFVSSSLNISVDANGVVTLEQAEFTDITEMQADIAALEAIVADMQGDLSAAGTDLATLVASITRLDGMIAGQATAATGTTSGTTALTVITSTLATVPDAGVLFVWGASFYNKTVATDVFSVTCRINAGVGATGGRDLGGASTGWATGMAFTTISAGTAPTVDLQLTRVSGTGTATTPSSALRWLFLPS